MIIVHGPRTARQESDWRRRRECEVGAATRGWFSVLSSQSPAAGSEEAATVQSYRVCIRDAFSNHKTLEYFMETFLDPHIIALRYMVLEE